MFTRKLIRTTQKILLAAGACAIAALGTTNALAAANCSITTDPSPPTINAGGSVTFTGSVSGKPPVTYDWTFDGGSLASSTDETVAVSYAAAGSYSATLDGSNDRGDTCNASVTVIVNQNGGGGNNPPVANDDAYSTDQDVPLNIAAPGVLGNDTDADDDPITVADPRNNATTAQNGTVTLNANGSFSYTPAAGFTGNDTFSYRATDGTDISDNPATVTITVQDPNAGGPTARGDAYATPVGKTLDVAASLVSGVLYNDFGGTPPLTAELVSGPGNGNLTLNADGSFSYTPNGTLVDNDNDSFTYVAEDALGAQSDVATVNINILSDQPDFKIMMNYELGMHCTGFEFAYCCVLPPYNSILAQIVKPQVGAVSKNKTLASAADFPRLLEGSHEVGLDGLGRPTVVQAGGLGVNDDFQHYMLEYYHDAQPRLEGQGKPQGPDTLISAVEGNSLFYTSTIYDSSALDANGALVTGVYEGVNDVVLGDGDFNDPTDNYANGWLNHFYIYADLEGSNPNGSSLEADKIRLGVTGHIEYPADVGAALQPMGPTGSAAGFDNLLTFSGDTGTVVYTQMKVLENLPIMLTSPGIWEALGLPLTPFEDSIDFFGDPGLVDEDSIRPYVAMKARLHVANCNQDPTDTDPDTGYGTCTQGDAVIGSNGLPVIGHGTAPIDIPNCERCHSVTDPGAANSPSNIRSTEELPGTHLSAGQTLEAITNAEYQFWNAYYGIVPGVDSDWYSRLKSAAINMLGLHDIDQGTGFTSDWPASTDTNPVSNPNAQNTRLGKESVICQKCHADNVIAAVKSATKNGNTIKPITEAIHWRHREISEGGNIDFADAAGRSGGCQGCHPAHRSDGVMDGYPITLSGDNEQADGDNRLAAGGCFVGRDVHSNPLKDVDGAETPEHLNAVGLWLSENVFNNQDGEAGIDGSPTRGLWCTNCHTQLGQEMWVAEDCDDLINGDCVNDVRGLGSLSQIANAIGSNLNEVESWLDPKNNQNDNNTPDGVDHSHRIWDPAVSDALLATIEVGEDGPVVTVDGDGDPSVNILSFCTTDDCVDRINNNKEDQSQWRHPANAFIDPVNNSGVAVPFSAATDGRDHWLSPGEPHCADCHAAPYVEQSGNINPFPPFNYPAKASLMRYSKGHQDISCQGCHESIHGLYPVTPTIDSTSYAQAAALNPDGSHGPLKCEACHEVDGDGIPVWMKNTRYNGSTISTFDDAVSWAHTATANATLAAGGVCQNCHQDRSSKIDETKGKWLRHSFLGRVGRKVQDEAEISAIGHVAGDPDTDGDGINDRGAQEIADTVCLACHSLQNGPTNAFLDRVSCDSTVWKSHVIDGRLSGKVWEFISHEQTGSSCGW